MRKAISAAITAIGLAAVLAAPTAASAEDSAVLNAGSSGDITWVELTATSKVTYRVTIKILNVTKHSRTLWQRCTFGTTGAGIYRCGFDSGPGSLARERNGRWLAKGFLDGVLVARQRFSL